MAIADGRLVGFVVGYRVPAALDTLFVWQVGVAAPQRGRGLASGMILWTLGGDEQAGVRFLEATVTASNGPSQRLFRSLARRLDAPCTVRSGFFGPDVFGTEAHEAEDLYRIGPFLRPVHAVP